MRAIVILLGATLASTACDKAKNEAIEEARKKMEADQKGKEQSGGVAKKVTPPVPGEARIPCERMVDPAKYTEALAEKEPMTVKDVTAKDREAASSCSLIRGGKRPSVAEQEKMLKKEPRLGVLPGDEVCNVTAYCWTLEEAEKFKKKCPTRGDRDDESMGTYACVQIVATGIYDVHVYRFFDEDTKCILQVRGGPSQTNNDQIRACATTARDTITKESIQVKEGDPKQPPPIVEGSGSAAAGSASK